MSPAGDDRLDVTGVEAFVERAGRDLDRLIVVTPTGDDRTPYLQSVFAVAGRAVPAALLHWDQQVDGWCDEYRREFGKCYLVEVNLTTAVFVFDRTHERVVTAYGVATKPLQGRDHNRMRRFPDVGVGVNANMGDQAFAADRGHFLSHAAGGELDINLFPQRRELNRGWSSEGKLFRRMERYVAEHAGAFHYHRAEYDDLTWIPATLEYGVLRSDQEWWVETFENK